MKILLNILTHGDESLGFFVARQLNDLIQEGILDVNIANPQAAIFGVRFIESDLNRVFPGKENGTYEERLAFDLAKKIKEYDVVIDIHSTTSDVQDVLIVTKLDEATREAVEATARRVLLMSVGNKNALISDATIGIAFEYGGENDPDVAIRTALGVRALVDHCMGKGKKSKQSPEYFEVYDTIPLDCKETMKNFELTTINGEEFYPLFIGEKSYQTFRGFKARSIHKTPQ